MVHDLTFLRNILLNRIKTYNKDFKLNLINIILSMYVCLQMSAYENWQGVACMLR